MKPSLKKDSPKSCLFITWMDGHIPKQLESHAKYCSIATPILEPGKKQYAASLVCISGRWQLQIHVNHNGQDMMWKKFQSIDLSNEETLCELEKNAKHE